ncbi:DNA methyltransferase [Luteolibacter sp. LG18]|uniref:DNA methyltransferase n=1 Tax=Luteolibacter sp. LG18 TaxID=2819286 RepID=UPI002B30E96D|nr:putative DNA methyltransferase YeeA [Luteolibacter sp. LG18]
MTTEEISKKIADIPSDLTGVGWGFAFLKCFQGKDSKLPKSTFDRVRDGSTNYADDHATEILWKKRIYFRWVAKDIRTAFDEAKASVALRRPANKPMFIVIASPDEIAAHDLDEGSDLVIPGYELPSHAYFFLPFVGKKKIAVTNEALEVDVKATRKMAVLYDEIRKDNPGFDAHDLNVFLARLLFCFFAEDTGIFEDDLFTNSLASHTSQEGDDLTDYLTNVFRRFATADASKLRKEFRNFPYVNGGLFEREHPVPAFTGKSRKTLLENGKMDWKSINPDIFGSMFQSIIDPEKRHELGMHYTSRENIMKVVSPLFLDALREDFEKAKGSPKKLEAFHQRLAEIHIFDPACGSGNFLILAYEKLRELEMDVLEAKGQYAELFPRIRINQFHGIEIDDFAHELAMLALWIKEHQMNLVFHERFRTRPDALPLREGARIVRDNATRCDWNTVCPRIERGPDGKAKQRETYVLGNPPYLGARNQSVDQKRDMAAAVGDVDGLNELDYVACWFFKASRYIRNQTAAAAFVATNSICQGEQAALIWHPIVGGGSGIEIGFAHTSFKWTNQAKGNAGVTCVVVGISNLATDTKRLFSGNQEVRVEMINEFLRPLPYVWVWSREDSLSGLPKLTFGSMPNDGGFLLMSGEEKNDLISSHPTAEKFLKVFVGADEFLYKEPRYCLWICDEDLAEARKIGAVQQRIASCRKKRADSPREATRRLAEKPHQFGEVRHRDTESIIFPRHTSEKREYIPLGFLDDSTVIGDAAQAIYDAQPWAFGVLSSKMHMEWTKLVAGRLKTDPRYSGFVLNNFPLSPLSGETKESLEKAVFEIIDIREEFHEMTYADMYDPAKMPEKLLKAHRALDIVVDRCYRKTPFKDVNDRLEHLIALYHEMTGQTA